jgi:hypothetical protein
MKPGKAGSPRCLPRSISNCRLFWRMGEAVAGLIGARLKTLSANRGKRGRGGPLALRQPLPVQRVRLGRRIDVATGSFRTPVHPQMDVGAARPKCPPRRNRSRFFPKIRPIAALAAGAVGKGTGRRSAPRALHRLGWKVELREARKGRIPGSPQLQCRTESGGSGLAKRCRINDHQSRRRRAFLPVGASSRRNV